MAFRLNRQQQEAVAHRDGPLLILAGAGSGKTGVITHRIVHLIKQGIPPYNILAVTFTNKAAKEMKERVTGMLNENPKHLVLSTFHAFAMRILRGEITRLGYKKNFTIYGTSDQKSLLRSIMKEVRVDINSFDEGLFLWYIDQWKNRLITPSEIVPKEKVEEWAKKVYELYNTYLKGYNALDFNDLISLVITLFEEHPDVLEKYQERFRYIMVDEYQDTNPAQYRLISLLAQKYRNLVVVGDDDQSIYAFRGADIRIILSFEEDYPEAKVIRLEENYRSTSAILNTANALIANNGARREKTLFTQMEGGSAPRVISCDDEREEAAFVVEDIYTKAALKGIPYHSFAVLYRVNAQSRLFEEELRMKGIPYRVVGAFEFYERKEIKDIISYLKVFHNPEDEVSLLRIINTPRRGIGDGTVVKLTQRGIEEGLPLYEVLLTAIHMSSVPARAQKGIKDFIDLIQTYRERFQEEECNITETVNRLLDELAYHSEVLNTSDTKEKATRKLENIESLVAGIGEYERRTKNSSLKGYLDRIMLVNQEEKNAEENQRGVTLLSIHSAKGLEFPFVYLVGMEDGYLPHFKCSSDEEVAEERRLCYVAITRAKQDLTFSYAVSRRKRGKKIETVPSVFLSEIPEHLLQGAVSVGDGVTVGEDEGFAFYQKMKEKFMSTTE